MKNKKIFSIKNLIITVLFIVLLLAMATIANATKIEKQEVETRDQKIKVTADTTIEKILVYKKASNGKYILFYRANPDENEFLLTIQESFLSTETETDIKIVVYEKDGVRTSGDITLDKLEPYPSINPEETEKPSWSPSTLPTKPTPSPKPSTSQTTTPSSSTTDDTPSSDEKITGGQAIAEAAVKLAVTSSSKETYRVDWPDTRVYNERTKTYIDARESLVDGHNIGKDGPPLLGDYASCDMGVAVAVRLSGVDKNFEFKEIPNQWEYLKGDSPWVSVGEFRGTPNDILKPGDVMINSHHIILYCGSEVIKQKYPDSDGELYEAGFWTEKGMSYYPRLMPLSSRNSDASDDPYTIFRNKNWDKKEYDKIL